MTVKKAYEEVVSFLEENKDKKVSSILDQVVEMCAARSRSGTASTVHRDDEGNVVAIFDYYFKKWMPLSHIEFGSKASSASGFNSMCKEGVSNWTRQQNEAKKAEAKLLQDAIDGKVNTSEMAQIKDEIEANRTRIVPHSTGIGFDTIEELLAADVAELDRMVAEAEEAAQPAETEESEAA